MHLPDFKVARSSTKIDYKKIDYELDSKYLNKYKGKKCFLKTYGCQMNEHDSENIKGILELLGFDFTDKIENSDLVLLNTCSIRENAHNKAFGLLGKAKHIKESKRDLMIGLCGCMAQEEIVVNTIMSKYPFVNFVIGTHNFYQLPEILEKSESKQQIEVYSREGDLIEDLPVDRTSKYKAYVNIIYGCDKFCTYCIVPYTRGRQRSREKEDILKEIDNLIKEGYQEVTLLGQNVNAYGKDLYDNYSLAELLEDVAKTNIPRIRFMTSHPWDFTDEMIEVIAKYPNIMPSIHLPVQSGSNRILKLMGRRYTKENYLTLFHKMKEIIPNCAISTDIIVGFPGETDEDFEETLKLVKECKYDNAYTFIYSPRVGTPAAKLTSNTTKEEKEQRLYKLNDIVNTYFKENNDKLVGKIVPVLVEGISDKKNEYFGYSDTNKLVNFTGDDIELGSIVDVEITEAKTWSLDGKVSK
ncbi:MAG TPA: tRNA (N6-isopentenyl adenosine(37)-C2)-methylthiotransferase MiaB [Candidatus Onthousia faecipullorum]|uniref:tRNA-2-methylthio-N(6)-dimethylallyladenosine synthase n=1 Tax=Candidatus Onthousia faecipullorum TaxID=2840887 RepID=A0A9D1GBI0_9FIRM|nr:tRNA (N6-isopentenyl adenosine(37)-C2)-methylthiotransferase MiaB [Candidatus Onthousia faecipullorum]